MRHLGFEIMLDVESDNPIPKEEVAKIAERVGFALQSYAEGSESGLVGELNAFTCGVVIRDLEGRHLASVRWYKPPAGA